MDLKSYVISTVDPTTYYTALFPEWTPSVRPNVSCPFHSDRSPSLAVGLSGGGAKCHASGCGISIGNVVHFESRRLGCDELRAAAEIYHRHVRCVVRPDVLAHYQSSLITARGRNLSSVLLRDSGLNSGVTSHFGCGFDERSGRLVIPIKNAWGLVVNLRFYKPRALRRAGEPTVYNYVENKGQPTERRYGGNELFPWEELRHFTDDHPVFIVASEKEAMLAYQLGLQAVSATAGEGSWMAHWSDSFVGFRVGTIMDPDAGGDKATTRLIAELSSVALVSLPIQLPFPRGFRGPQDLDDWVVHCSGSGERILALFEQRHIGAQGPGSTTDHTPRRTMSKTSVKRVLPSRRAKQTDKTTSVTEVCKGPKVPVSYIGPDNTNFLPLDHIRKTPAALNRIVTSHGLVSAVAQRSFSIPYKFRVKTKQGPPRIFTMPIGRELLGFVNGDDTKVSKTVLGLLGSSGRNTTVEAVEYHSVTELELIPLAETAVANNTESNYTVQRCFAVGIALQANLAYEFKLVPTTMPQTQETVCAILEASEKNRQAEVKLDEATVVRFQPFRADDDAVWSHLECLVREIAEHHTHIYERPDWHMVVLLTFFSPLQWTWPLDGKIQRGWMNTLAVGDTKTGKSEVTGIVTSQLLQAGDIVNSENCTMVGLVGGAIKGASGQFMLRWGRLPLADRKLVVLEELSGLSVEEISNMSDVRSSGVARLDKGGLASQTPARTRLLCLSNVRSRTKRLADFLSGVRAVQELVGHAEDLSRFDLVITLTDSEVSPEVINRASTGRVTRPKWTVSDIRLLCQWVWSLSPNQIEITDEAATRCLELTLELGKDYHSGVPLFKASSDRHKVARIAVSIACLQFSWDGHRVLVTPSHMEAAVKLMRQLYDKPSLGYREWSRQMFDREEIRDTPELDNVFINVQPDHRLRSRSAEVMIHAAKFSRDELCATASLTITQADYFLGTMLRCRAIRKGDANVWEITPAGKKWLESVMNENVTSHLGTNGHRSTSPTSSKSQLSFSEAWNTTKPYV